MQKTQSKKETIFISSKLQCTKKSNNPPPGPSLPASRSSTLSLRNNYITSELSSWPLESLALSSCSSTISSVQGSSSSSTPSFLCILYLKQRLFGFMMVAAEFKIKFLLRECHFLTHLFGRGIFFL